jgi:hypothetical protein
MFYIHGISSASNSATQKFQGNEPLLGFLFDLLTTIESFPSSVQVSAVTLLEVLSEDNPSFQKNINENIISMLSAQLRKGADVALPAARCLLHFKHVTQPGTWMEDSLLLIQQILVTHNKLLDDFNVYRSKAPTMTVDCQENLAEPIDEELNALTSTATQMSSSLELLANLISFVIEPDSVENDDWEDQEVDEDLEASADLETVVPAEVASNLQQEALETISSSEESIYQYVKSTQSGIQAQFANILQSLVAIVTAGDISDLNLNTASNSSAYLLMQNLRVRASATLNNLFFSILGLPDAKKGNHPFPLLNLLIPATSSNERPRLIVNSLFSVLSSLNDRLLMDIQAIFQFKSDDDVQLRAVKAQVLNATTDLVSMNLACLWGLVKNFDSSIDAGGSRWIDLPPHFIQTMIELYAAPFSTEDIQRKLIGLLGVLGRRQGNITANQEIGKLFYNLLTEVLSISPGILSEVLNAMFDVYGDKDYDYDTMVFKQNNFIALLKQITPSVKNIARAVDRRRQPDLRDSLDEALLNLRAFVTYKENEYRTN